MKHIKLFEDFFSFFLFDKLSDETCDKIFGVTREELKYKLSDITDEIEEDLHISINFKINNGVKDDSTTKFVLKDGKYYTREKDVDDDGNDIIVDWPIEELGIEISFFPSEQLLNSRRKGSWSEKFSIVDIVNKIDQSIKNNKLEEYFKNMGYEVDQSDREKIDASYHNHPEAKITYGTSIYTLFIDKKID